MNKLKLNILNYKGYYTKIHYSAEDEVLYGKVEGIKNLVSFESASVKEIKKEFQKAVDDYVCYKKVKRCLMKNRDKPKLLGGFGEINFGKQYRQGNRVYDSDHIAMCLCASPIGNMGGYSYLYLTRMEVKNEKAYLS